MQIKRFDYTPILGWSVSRYDTFSVCKRRYYYQYYGKYDREHSIQKIEFLKGLTSIPLEIGSIVHGVIKALLLRLQKSDSAIDSEKLLEFIRRDTEKQCQKKAFFEVYYKETISVTAIELLPKIETCLHSFLSSKRYDWIKQTAIDTRNRWIIEPPGYGEARLGEQKVYCKVDFLFPVDDRIVIIDWKTGKQAEEKYTKQLTGYTAWVSYHLDRSAVDISPIIAYLQPDYEEIKIIPSDKDLSEFRDRIQIETEEMYGLCKNVEDNIPLSKESFPMTKDIKVCRFCNFKELCVK